MNHPHLLAVPPVPVGKSDPSQVVHWH
jgi:hypothetical protein